MEKHVHNIIVPAKLRNRATTDNYRALLKLALDAQRSGNDIILKMADDNRYCVTDSEGTTIWSETTPEANITEIGYKSVAWENSEKSVLVKEFMKYNTMRNSKILGNHLKESTFHSLPIDHRKYNDTDVVQSFDNFISEQSVKMKRKPRSIKMHLVKLGIMENLDY